MFLSEHKYQQMKLNSALAYLSAITNKRSDSKIFVVVNCCSRNKHE